MDQLSRTGHSCRLAAASLVAGTAILLAGGAASAKGNPHPGGGSSPAASGHAGDSEKGRSNHTSPGDSNAGDVWTDNVGQPAGPGHEQDPHLACADINIWGAGLADTSGTYTVDGWPPSGTQEQDYASTWSYNTSAGGVQVISVISSQRLIATAVANGDAPKNRNGFHFKLNLVQDPQKHKTFWLACPAPTGHGTTNGGGTTTTGGGNGNVGGTTSSTPAPIASAHGQPGTTPSGSVLGVATSSQPGGPAGGVLGVSTPVPATGVAIAAGLVLALLGGGTSLVVIGRRRRSDPVS
jgi:hypothetical protein